MYRIWLATRTANKVCIATEWPSIFPHEFCTGMNFSSYRLNRYSTREVTEYECSTNAVLRHEFGIFCDGKCHRYENQAWHYVRLELQIAWQAVYLETANWKLHIRLDSLLDKQTNNSKDKNWNTGTSTRNCIMSTVPPSQLRTYPFIRIHTYENIYIYTYMLAV